MTLSQLRPCIKEVIGGIQGELGSTISLKTKVALEKFQKQLDKPLTPKQRKRFEQDFEAYVQGNHTLRIAADRYLSKKVPEALAKAAAAMMQALPYLTTNRSKRTEDLPN